MKGRQDIKVLGSQIMVAVFIILNGYGYPVTILILILFIKFLLCYIRSRVCGKENGSALSIRGISLKKDGVEGVGKDSAPLI